MGLQGDNTAKWYRRAAAVLVNGVSSQFRYWSDDDTLVVERGEGGHVIDMDGNRYIDYQLGFGPIILGHGDETVASAVAEAAAAGTTFAMTQRREVEAAEKVMEALPWADAMRFTNTGTEATMHSVRLARGLTGRDLVVKFEGTYHGGHDYLMFSTASSHPGELGPREQPEVVLSSKGIPSAIKDYIRTVPFNDLPLLEALLDSEGDRVAALIIEPMMGNAFGFMPDEGFLQGVRSLCDRHGALLIFDEVKTGFRMAVGGAHQAFGVVPDIGTYAKAIGNGFPAAAIATRGEVADGWRSGGIFQAGTYSGNGLSAAAVRATVDRLLTGEPLARVEKVGTALMEGMGRIISDHGVEGRVTGHPSMFSLFFGEGDPKEFRDTSRHDKKLYEEVCMRMIPRGVMPCPDALEPWFICAAHTDEDVAKTLEVFEKSLGEALESR
jgi:glutamate-1-semialdehyde 2,1-aminomutase